MFSYVRSCVLLAFVGVDCLCVFLYACLRCFVWHCFVLCLVRVVCVFLLCVLCACLFVFHLCNCCIVLRLCCARCVFLYCYVFGACVLLLLFDAIDFLCLVVFVLSFVCTF